MKTAITTITTTRRRPSSMPNSKILASVVDVDVISAPPPAPPSLAAWGKRKYLHMSYTNWQFFTAGWACTVSRSLSLSLT